MDVNWTLADRRANRHAAEGFAAVARIAVSMLAVRTCAKHASVITLSSSPTGLVRFPVLDVFRTAPALLIPLLLARVKHQRLPRANRWRN
jgi:hypothetical protein